MTKLFVIPGHGAGDSGACGNGYQEQERVRALATAIKKYGGDSVMLADFSRNYYADGGINRLTISKDYKIVELHMDSAQASAKGGHVIIQAGIGGADEWDRKLADLMLKWFPGRSSRIVERDDLANPARAAARGYNYRLVENGFISNAGDVKTFNSHLDEIAKGYCECFGIVKEKPKAWTLNMWTPNGSDAQRFAVEWDAKKEWFRLRCKADGRYLDVKGAGKSNGTVVQVYEGNGSDAQWWRFEPCTTDYDSLYATPVYLVPKCAPDKVIDIYGHQDANGAKLVLWNRYNGGNQQWTVVANNNSTTNDGTITLVTNWGSHRALDVYGGGR